MAEFLEVHQSAISVARRLLYNSYNRRLCFARAGSFIRVRDVFVECYEYKGLFPCYGSCVVLSQQRDINGSLYAGREVIYRLRILTLRRCFLLPDFAN